jgi:hypothetical protein
MAFIFKFSEIWSFSWYVILPLHKPRKWQDEVRFWVNDAEANELYYSLRKYLCIYGIIISLVFIHFLLTGATILSRILPYAQLLLPQSCTSTDCTSSWPHPFACLAGWLPGAYAPASVPLRVTGTRKPPLNYETLGLKKNAVCICC